MIRWFATVSVVLVCLWLASPVRAQSVHMEIEVRLEPQSGEVVIVESLQVRGEALAHFRLPPEFSLKNIKIDGPGSRLSRKGGVWTLHFEGAIDHRITLVFNGVLASIGDATGGAAGPGTTAGSAVTAQTASSAVRATTLSTAVPATTAWSAVPGPTASAAVRVLIRRTTAAPRPA